MAAEPVRGSRVAVAAGIGTSRDDSWPAGNHDLARDAMIQVRMSRLGACSACRRQMRRWDDLEISAKTARRIRVGHERENQSIFALEIHTQQLFNAGGRALRRQSGGG